MNFPLLNYVIICPLVFLAGFIDSIAGGGGLISLPAYLACGLPIHTALGTNKLSGTLAAVTASINYYRKGLVTLWLAVPCAIGSLAGAVLGSRISLYTNDTILRCVLIAILPITAIYVLKTPQSMLLAGEYQTKSKKKLVALGIIVSFFVGMYDGFYGPGTGTFYIILYTAVLKLNPLNASANAKVANLSSNIAALTVFIYYGTVNIGLGLIAGVFGIAGAYFGSRLAIKKGAKIIRIIMLITIVILFAKIIYDTFGSSIRGTSKY
ncbi:MAG: TSUP family transporter [Termitinemataceae bacterium]|nr:MAG: TSUP family transporter [Termitinemataceae bacterium]